MTAAAIPPGAIALETIRIDPVNAGAINPGAINLLKNCAKLREGDHVVLAVESPTLGYYNSDLCPSVLATAQSLGCRVTVIDTGFDPEAREIPDTILAQCAGADAVVFLSRLGDQLRFNALPNETRTIQCYALDAASLGSCFGTVPYSAMKALRDATDRAFAEASEIRITCPNGTDVTGRAPRGFNPSDTTCLRFPLAVFSPIPAGAFSGRVALPGFLTGTGSRYYHPFTIDVPKGTFAQFEQGRLIGFSGPADGVRLANEHYDLVATRYDLDRNAIHSWHAGIHPGCKFDRDIQGAYEAWSGSAFGNPRILHFHTCGALPPGEISWNVIDATIQVDGESLWERGVFQPHLVAGGSAIVQATPELADKFADPEQAIGF
ncbi:hypothetical protein O4H61_01570 [Roseovarius aestuarii]|nr:hypothetical protein [Roseovarius aestuarii]